MKVTATVKTISAWMAIERAMIDIRAAWDNLGPAHTFSRAIPGAEREIPPLSEIHRAARGLELAIEKFGAEAKEGGTE